jgi:hypothetical protein
MNTSAFKEGQEVRERRPGVYHKRHTIEYKFQNVTGTSIKLGSDGVGLELDVVLELARYMRNEWSNYELRLYPIRASSM